MKKAIHHRECLDSDHEYCGVNFTHLLQEGYLEVLVHCCSLHNRKMDIKELPFQIASNEVVGRHFIASVDLKPGDIILRESPVITGPPVVTDQLVCVACYKVIDENNSSYTRCPRCGWSVCSEECSTSDVHLPECQLTCSSSVAGKINIDVSLKEHPVYYSLIILRGLLLKNSNPVAWQKLQELESHCNRRRATGDYEKDRKTVASFLLSQFRLEGEYTEEDILKMCGAVQVNSYPVRLNEPFSLAVYDVASFIEHNCVPNCAKIFTAKGELILKAARLISKGEHLSICYTDPTLGTRPRRQKLLEELLPCRCQRCCDPTELQSFFSALRCSDGCPGNILPEQPILEDTNNNNNSVMDDDMWRCSDCASAFPGSYVERILESASQAAAQVDKNNLQACQKFLSIQTEILHCNHYILLPVRLSLVNRNLSGVLDKDLIGIYSEINKLLSLAELILPGENKMRGMLLFRLATAVIEMFTRGLRCKDNSIGKPGNGLQEPENLLRKAADMLCDEPDLVPEGKLAHSAEELLLTFNSVL